MQRREFITLLGAAAAAWPMAARAQRGTVPVIGLLAVGVPQPRQPRWDALRAGLAELGYREGQTFTTEYRGWGNANYAAMRVLAEDLINHRAAVIVATGALAPIEGAKAATSDVPVVFLYGGDPVDDGLVASLNRPGGNLTGMGNANRDLAGKRLDLLHKMVPQAMTIGFLSGTPSYTTYKEQTSTMRAAAEALGLRLDIVECRSELDFEAAFSTFDEHHVEALILGTFPFNLGPVVALAARHRIPAIYPGRGFVEMGGLMSYDADMLASYRQLGARYVGPILKGTKPADLPVQLPTKFDFVINLRTAKALGLTVPAILQATADEVIE
jgi:putative ABC transport system substrate-binding protein